MNTTSLDSFIRRNQNARREAEVEAALEEADQRSLNLVEAIRRFLGDDADALEKALVRASDDEPEDE